MVKRNLILILTIFFILNYSILHAYLSRTSINKDDIIENIEFGYINWTKGIITIIGKSKIPEVMKNDRLLKNHPEKYAKNLATARKHAKTAANRQAEKNLYNAVINIRIHNEYFIKSYLINSTNNFKHYLNNLLSDAKKRRFIYKDNSIQVELKLKIYNEDSVMSLFIKNLDNPPVSFYTRDNYDQYIKTLNRSTNSSSQVYTSLIIDTTEFKLLPALFPKLYSEKGIEILSSKIIPKDKIIKKGIAVYISDIKKINNYKFIDSGAFIIKAIKIINKTDIILPDEEIERFISNKKTLNYLQNCSILIIIN